MKGFKLNALEANELESVKGGYKADCDAFPHHSCGCGCYYANSGGSSTDGNYSANGKLGIWSDYKGDKVDCV